MLFYFDFQQFNEEKKKESERKWAIKTTHIQTRNEQTMQPSFSLTVNNERDYDVWHILHALDRSWQTNERTEYSARFERTRKVLNERVPL